MKDRTVDGTTATEIIGERVFILERVTGTQFALVGVRDAETERRRSSTRDTTANRRRREYE